MAAVAGGVAVVMMMMLYPTSPFPKQLDALLLA
jgi:hypothetical protein